jgi:FkbM family methyltransferase
VLNNRFNWQALPRALAIFSNPVEFLWDSSTGRFPTQIEVRSPIGPVMIALRNYESLKTCFSIFAREDYRTDARSRFIVLDIGANIGVAALYFLSRNRFNRVRCYEPDPANLDYLRRNLEPFRDRVEIVEKAVAPRGGTATLFRAVDGKHSSLRQDVAVSNGFAAESPTELVAFDEVLRGAEEGESGDLLVKIDVEGIEPDLVRSVDFSNHPRVRRVLVESTRCSALIRRPHRRVLRIDSIEDIQFS